ncbi:MAG: M10 family metallopeptidase C-terminal domain-containing protein [Bauldia sp.]|nr:M10 family metallopeptidase C-terminal domain-containing protein [Bauldia sp.]
MVDFIGNDAPDATIGGYGDQYGAGSNDFLQGDATGGNLYGGAGRDILTGGTLVSGGINGAGTAEDPYVLTGFNASPDNVLEGGTETDILYGADGNDTIYGGDGDDSGVALSYLAGLYWKAGLFGGDGDDSLYGGKGDDLLEGGLGRDHLYGGQDADTFAFKDKLETSNKKSLADVIHDFERKLDKVDLSGIDADENTAGDQEFDYIKKKKFSSEAGELRYKKGYLMGDTDGDGHKDFVVKVHTDTINHGDYKLGNADFIL